MNKQLKTIGIVVLSVVVLNRGLPAMQAQQTTHALLAKPGVVVQARSHQLNRTRPQVQKRASRPLALKRMNRPLAERQRFLLLRRRIVLM